MTTLGEMMSRLRADFSRAGIEDPMAEARILIGGIAGLTRTDFISRSGDHLSPADAAAIEAASKRRVNGEPVHRILGRRGFHGLDLKLSKDTLEPRPDTEVLVDLVLDLVETRKDEALDILDLGTGTGAICLALVSALPKARGTGTDLASGALETARENATLNGLSDRFVAVHGSWFENISGSYDVIVSNPPYIRSEMIPALDREVRDHDPLLALDGGADGLDAYRVLAAGAGRFLKADGIVAVETGFDQKNDVWQIFAANDFRVVRSIKDLAGNDRAQAFRRKN